MYVTNAELRSAQMDENRKKELLQGLIRTKTPDDKVAAMFSFLKKNEIPLDTERIHRAFYRLKEKYPDILEEFVFSRNDVYPFSALLERTLFRLQNSGLISTVNPDFKRCIISDESKTYIQEHTLPIFQDEEKHKLEEMGKMFEQLMTSET
jgi:hypothetical protein